MTTPYTCLQPMPMSGNATKRNCNKSTARMIQLLYCYPSIRVGIPLARQVRSNVGDFCHCYTWHAVHESCSRAPPRCWDGEVGLIQWRYGYCQRHNLRCRNQSSRPRKQTTSQSSHGRVSRVSRAGFHSRESEIGSHTGNEARIRLLVPLLSGTISLASSLGNYYT